MSEARTLVEVEGLRRTFDVSRPWLTRMLAREPQRFLKAVDGVSFDIKAGETFAIVGESGSGKSTVARMVVGLLEATAGKVTIDRFEIRAGADSVEARRVRRRIQMIFQDPFASLNPRWRVGDIIAEPIIAFGMPKPAGGRDDAPSPEATRRRVGELLGLVGLDPVDARKYPHQFSGGQRQRIAIARALAAGPDFIACDEPTSALDVSVQAQILNLMRDLQEQLGLTFLFISHNLSVVRHMATRVGVMYLGKLVEIGNAAELFARPRHPYTRMLLDSVPDLSMVGKDRTPVAGEIPSPIDPPKGCAFHPRCKFAVDICRIDVPPLIDGVACHLAQDGRLPDLSS
ncbi:MAG: ATP-binding cassette domain-containing protein [Beijerinckiaceae bacterium]|nr:ATP-binding cassette domain-containing protein [Beijerinckiaceae bacterium]